MIGRSSEKPHCIVQSDGTGKICVFIVSFDETMFIAKDLKILLRKSFLQTMFTSVYLESDADV